MILLVHCLKEQTQRQQLLLVVLLLHLATLQRNFDVSAQWITITEFSMRVPGRCMVASGTNRNSGNSRRQLFDCSGSKLLPLQQRHCIPLQHFHDGIVDCPDGSDEFCFPGYIKCGLYCVLPQHAAQCFINPKCDDSPTSPQFCDVIKKKLCSIEGTVPCKGYGECVLRKWIEYGQTNCIDRSDQDLAYIAVFDIKRGINSRVDLQFGTNAPDIYRGMINNGRYVPSWLQPISPSISYSVGTDAIARGTVWSTTTERNTATQSTTTKFVFRVPNNRLNFATNYNNQSGATEAFAYTTVRTSTAAYLTVNPSVKPLQQQLSTYHRDQNSTQNFAKFENSLKTSTNSHNYEKLDGNRYNGLLLPINPIRTNDNNRFGFGDNTKQDNVVGISLLSSLSSPASVQPQTPNNTSNLSATTVSDTSKRPQQASSGDNDILANITTRTTGSITGTTDSITETTTGPSSDQIACARYEYAEVKRLVPEPSCTCPPGQMPTGKHATCKTTTVSTFGIDVSDMCGGLESAPEERSRLAILVLNRTRLPYHACVRRDGHPVIVQLDCSHCTLTEFEEAFRRDSIDQYIPLRIMELSLGACLSSTLNDCDPENADCLVDGPRYECRCHDGWNDTSKEFGQAKGRRCGQLALITNGCTRFLGYCLSWWFLLFGLILISVFLLLCWLCYKLYQFCQKRGRRNIVEQGHLVTSEVGSIKNSNPTLGATESINMNNISNSVGTVSDAESEKAVTIVDTKAVSNCTPTRSQNISKSTNKVLIKQQSVKSLDTWKKNDEIKANNKQHLQMQSELLEELDEGQSEKTRSERKIPFNDNITTDVPVPVPKKLNKSTSEEQGESSDSSLESQTSTAMMSVIPKKRTEMLRKNEKMMKNFANIESTNAKVMNISQSLSETSLRTMWELFKQGKWKQSSRPSSIKSSTSSLDRLMCQKRSKKIHPDAITTCNSMEYPLDTVKVVDLEVGTTPQLTNSIFTTVNNATTATHDAVSNDKAHQFTTEAPIHTQVLEQKIVTETKTLTTRSTISLLPRETPVPVKIIATQQPNPLTLPAMIKRSEIAQHDQQPASSVALNVANNIPHQNDSIDATFTVASQHFVADENATADQEPSTIVQTENDWKEQMDTKPSTTTIVSSSDEKLKRYASITEPDSCELQSETQFEHGKQLTVTQKDDAEEKTTPIAIEMKDALQEKNINDYLKVVSTKPPTKRLTEKQKKKLTASCGHLHIHGDDKMRKEDGFVRQSLAATKHKSSRRKLSSISEKSVEITSSGGQLISAPSSISCPTTTRICKDHREVPHTLQRYRDSASGVWNCFFEDLMRSLREHPTKVHRTKTSIDDTTMQNSCKLTTALEREIDQNGTDDRAKRRKDSDTSTYHQCPTSTAGPLRNFLPLKDDLNRFVPFQPGFPHSYQPRKLLSSSHLKEGCATTSQLGRRNFRRCQKDEWNTMIRGSQSARLPSAKTLVNSRGVKWIFDDDEGQNRPVKEQLWWDAR